MKGVSKMNKIFGIVMVVLVVLAFSGSASAASISHKGGTTKYYGDNNRVISSWYMIKANKNSVSLCYKETYQMYTYNDDGTGYWSTTTVSSDVKHFYKKAGHPKTMYYTDSSNLNGKKWADSVFLKGKDYNYKKYNTADSYLKHYFNHYLSASKNGSMGL